MRIAQGAIVDMSSGHGQFRRSMCAPAYRTLPHLLLIDGMGHSISSSLVSIVVS